MILLFLVVDINMRSSGYNESFSLTNSAARGLIALHCRELVNSETME